MPIIEDISCESAHCVSIHIPSNKPLGAVLKHLNDEIASHSSNIVKEIIRSVQHLVNVYKCDDKSLIIFMNENVICVLTDRSVATYEFYIDNKFFTQADCNGEQCKD